MPAQQSPSPPSKPNEPSVPKDPPGDAGRAAPERRTASPWALAGAGMELAGVMGVLTVGGWWLDEKYATGPWLMFAGLVAGMVGGTYNVWRIGRKYFGDA